MRARSTSAAPARARGRNMATGCRGAAALGSRGPGGGRGFALCRCARGRGRGCGRGPCRCARGRQAADARRRGGRPGARRRAGRRRPRTSMPWFLRSSCRSFRRPSGVAAPRTYKRPSPPGEGPGFRRCAVASGVLPPSPSRLPPGAGNKGKKPEYEELELAEQGYGKGRGHPHGNARTVLTDGHGEHVARPVSQTHDRIPLLIPEVREPDCTPVRLRCPVVSVVRSLPPKVRIPMGLGRPRRHGAGPRPRAATGRRWKALAAAL